MKIIDNYKKKHEFNAENCRLKQQRVKDENYLKKLEEIQARIDFVVNNSNDEHAVIYCIKPYDKEMYDRLADYFYGKGFYTVKTKIEGLENEYLIISW